MKLFIAIIFICFCLCSLKIETLLTSLKRPVTVMAISKDGDMAMLRAADGRIVIVEYRIAQAIAGSYKVGDTLK